ncbi:MAG: DUF368 domain-containing protein [Lachnospiraceae bacterium]|nr:DUF368 domain-containing protein [Lachnospiraceae bacterium]
MIMRFIQGFCMALADSVPGVSGGTIAFLLGFYDDFIGSLNDIVSKDKNKRKNAIIFLIKIGIGWVVGMVLAILFITAVFESNIYQISSLFIGFIIFAIPIIIMEEKKCLKGKYLNCIFVLIGAAFVAGITYFSNSSILSEGVNLAFGELNIGLCVLLLVAGMVAISAMVLPGISGSTILMIFGLYLPVITAIKDILHLKFEYIPAVVIFGIGVIIGALLVVRLIKKMLEKFRSQTVYFIIGMMLGSLYSIAMGPTTLKDSEGVLKGLKMLSFDTFSVVFFVIGGVIIFGLQALKTIMEKKENA